MNSVKIDTPAKINFGLLVADKRNDGYHNLDTIFYPIHDLTDTITITKSDVDLFTCNVDEVNNADNLVLQAKRNLEMIIGNNLQSEINLQKSIPTKGGLGGGSSDCAAALKGFNTLFELELTDDRLSEIAIKLGADVPFFLNPVPSHGTGRGEILAAFNIIFDKYILLVKPLISISTKDAFEKITPQKRSLKKELIKILVQENNWHELSNSVVNDFEKTIFPKYPAIARIKSEMEKSGAVYSSLTGTGSTVYGFFDTIDDAEKCMNNFSDHYFKFISRPLMA